jgi:hypothetical protein
MNNEKMNKVKINTMSNHKYNKVMKTTRFFLGTALFVIALMIQSCDKLNETKDYGILPSKFKVDIPSSLSSDQAKSSYLKSAQADTLKGDQIYGMLKLFIAIGEGAGDVVQGIIGAIVIYHIDKPMTLSYESNDDHRIKNLTVVANADYNSKTYEYMLTITDAQSESNADGGKALQIFWNRNPIEGIAIIKPYNCNRIKDALSPNAAYRIEYSEVPADGYDSHMIVDIAGLPMSNTDQFAVKALKMFVGKKGNFVDVYGNTEHPNAKFFTNTTGFDWAFVASGLSDTNIGVAEVGIPPCKLDNSTRSVLLGDYSIKNVLTTQINTWFLEVFGVRPNADDLSKLLKNADAPGFFSDGGFIQAGTSPDTKYTPLVSRISSMAPYNPATVDNLTISFK